MKRKLKAVLFVLVLIALSTVAFVGCSFGGGGGSKGVTTNRCYILRSGDFDGFLSNMLSSEEDGEKKKDKDKYEVPAVEEMTIGDVYYVVCYTKASTKDGSNLEFAKGELILRTGDSEILISDAIEVLDYGDAYSNGAGVGVVSDDEDGSMLTYKVSPYANGSEAQFVVFLEIKVKAEVNLSAEYSVNGTIKKNTYGVASRSTAKANAYYPNKINLSELNISYLSADAYGEGRYDTSSLVSSVDMKVGKEYFMVITAKVKSLLEKSDNEMLTLDVNVSPLSVVDGTLEEAGSGQFSETKTDTEKNISVSFKIPDPSEDYKEITFIIKITPVSLGSPSVKIGFSATEISILGNQNKTEKTLLINGVEKTSEGFEYTPSSDKSYYIVKGLGEAKGSIFLIPATYNEKPVKEIADRAFNGLKNIKSIEISEGIERIGSGAFQNCTSLLTVKFPSTAALGSNVLSGCTSVTTLTANLGGGQLRSLFGSSVPTALKTVTLVGDTTLVANAFTGGSKIESISLPSTLTSVGSSAFSDCSSLTSLTLDSQNQSLFVQCGILYEKTSNKVLGHVSKFTGEMTYPAGVTSVPGGDMSGVTSIKLPDSVISFSSSVTGLAPKTAEGPQFLFGYVNKANLTHAVMTSGTTAPSFSGSTTLVSVSLPSTVSMLTQSAFKGCTSLKTVTLPSSLTAIPNGAFNGCTSLTSVNIPSEVKSIGEQAFRGCEALTSISIPSGVTVIGSSAFENCKKLTSVALPDIGVSIPESLFSGCTSLTSVSFSGTVSYIHGSVFYGCASLASFTVPDTVKNIGERAFCRSGLKTIYIPSGVSFIGSFAFAECESLTAITVDEANTSYFSECGILYDSNKPTKIMQVPKGISGKVTLSKTITGINTADFNGCTKITELIIPNNVGCVAPGAFTSCTNLNSIKWLYLIGERDGSSTYNSSKRQMQSVSWDNSYELATLMKRTYSDRYFGSPDYLK